LASQPTLRAEHDKAVYKHVKDEERAKRNTKKKTGRKEKHANGSNQRSKTKSKGRETVKTTRRGSEIMRSQGTQQEDKRNIRTDLERPKLEQLHPP